MRLNCKRQSYWGTHGRLHGNLVVGRICWEKLWYKASWLKQAILYKRARRLFPHHSTGASAILDVLSHSRSNSEPLFLMWWMSHCSNNGGLFAWWISAAALSSMAIIRLTRARLISLSSFSGATCSSKHLLAHVRVCIRSSLSLNYFTLLYIELNVE